MAPAAKWLLCDGPLFGGGVCIYAASFAGERCIKHGALLSDAPLRTRGMSRKEVRAELDADRL